jgi:hypothetical protein
MLKIDINIDGLKKLDQHIEFVNKMLNMKTDKDFQKYIQNKCMETLKKVMNERLTGGSTDDEFIEEYKNNNFIEETSDGFIIYNHTVIPQSMLPVSKKTAENYPNGFSLSLAFEYGVGIVGENAPVEGAWEYNVNNRNWAWRYQKYGETFSTYGYEGFEIYRFTAIEIQKNLKYWVNSYYTSKKGA